MRTPVEALDRAYAETPELRGKLDELSFMLGYVFGSGDEIMSHKENLQQFKHLFKGGFQ